MESAPVGRRTERGWELRHESRGLGRFLGAAFMLVWIAGWAVGETFALGVLVKGVVEWVRNGAPAPGEAPAASIAVVVFLLVWLSFWTLGGVMAIRELLRLLWGGTLVIAGPEGVLVERWAGPFRSRKQVPRDAIQAVRLQPRGLLGLETTRGAIDLVRSSRAGRLEQFAEELRRELRLVRPGEAASAPELPAGWADVLTPEGVVALTRDPAIRRRQVLVLAALTLAAGAIALFSMRPGEDSGGLSSLAITSGLAALAFGAGTLWLAFGRNEWCLTSGRLVLQRRMLGRVSLRFIASGLELSMSTDSDGDQWFALDATALPPDPSSPPPDAAVIVMGRAVRTKAEVRRIARGMNDASVPRALGRWLADRGRVPFLDRTRLPARQAISVAELRLQLAASGRFGAFLDRLVGPVLERWEKKQGEGPL